MKYMNNGRSRPSSREEVAVLQTVPEWFWITAGIVALLFSALIFAHAAPSDTAGQVAHSAAPGISAPKQAEKGEVGTETIVGKNLQKMQVGKFDPPAAFNLEDIQNFPEERLQPVLNNPINFEEGRDFSIMMSFQDEQLYHPWLPQLSQAPFLTMKPNVDKPPTEWTFAIIDQAGATVWKQDGKGTPPPVLTWNGEDSIRDHAAVDTVYIPQLATTDKEGYHHTYMGQPIQFNSIVFKNHGETVIELSSKNLFMEKKPDLSKEAPLLLEKVCDVIREDAHLPFKIQPYDNDSELAHSRQQNLVKYFSDKLYIPATQIIVSDPVSADKRGSAMAIIASGNGGSDK
jgi:hypothetical protein